MAGHSRQKLDLTGQRYGKLTVLGPAENIGERTAWHCRCDCGQETVASTRDLRQGLRTSCGCDCVSVVKPGQRDITGMRFGMLTAIEPSGQAIRGSAVWRCRCDCGGEVYAPLHQLTAGYRKSCGCLSHPARKDYVGRRFGRLTVIEYAGKRGGMHRWKCLCDCGNETIVGQTLLQTGKTKSCGCMQAETYRDNLKLIDGTSVTLLEAGKDRLIASNTSGHTGVYFNRRNGRWVAQITFKGKTYYLGSYAGIEEAILARKRGEAMHDDFLKWYHANYPKGAAAKSEGGERERVENTEA